MKNNDELIEAIKELTQSIHESGLKIIAGKIEDLQKEMRDLNSSLVKVVEELSLMRFES